MRIALITDGVFPYVLGGIQRHSQYLARYLSSSGVNVDLYHTASKLTEEVKQLTALPAKDRLNINSIPIQGPQLGVFPGHYIRESMQYSRLVLEAFQNQPTQVDFVYVQGLTGWALMKAKSKGMSLPPVGLNLHGLEMWQKHASLKSKLEQWVLRPAIKHNLKLADYHFSYGGKITTLLRKRGIDENKIIEIPNGIESSWVKASVHRHEAPVRFLFMGRNERRKGIVELNAAIRQLLSKVNFRFSFIGPIPAEMEVDHERVEYFGLIKETPEMHKIMDQCQVLVCPSYSEGMPNVIIEAMARGLAIVATDVGAVSQMVAADNGWLIEAGKKKALQSAILEAAGADPGRIKSMGEASIHKVKDNFLWTKIAQLTTEKISQLL